MAYFFKQVSLNYLELIQPIHASFSQEKQKSTTLFNGAEGKI